MRMWWSWRAPTPPRAVPAADDDEMVVRESVGRSASERPASVRPLPHRSVHVIVHTSAILLTAAVVWLVAWVAVRLALLTVSLIVAALLAALCTRLVRWLCRHGTPAFLASIIALTLVVGTIVGTGFLVFRRVSNQADDLRSALTEGVDGIRQWLTSGPLSLDPGQVDEVRDLVVSRVQQAAPSAAVGAVTVLEVLVAAALVLFTLFFLLKDGEQMWCSIVALLPERQQGRTDGAGRAAWSTLSDYTRGIVVVALIDAVGIGVALYVLGVPLFLSLTLLVFLGAFVPIIGATVSGAVAVLVTLVTNGGGDAVIIIAVVLAVQQLEGNVLSPLIVGHAVRLHPVVITVAVTAGTLLAGVAGALVAVPLAAVIWSVATYVRRAREQPAG